jgi:NADPH:quinone reductase-like Zn-dependent oxidoreductase
MSGLYPNGAGHERYEKGDPIMRALQITAYGDPLNVLELVDIPEPGAPGTGEILIDVEVAPLNLHDLLFMRGHFGGPPAPTVVGNEGFGRVAAVVLPTLRSATTS